MTDYYKSRGLSEPVIYAQEDGRWLTYDAQGGANESPGAIPASVLEHLEPISASEAESVTRSRREKTAVIASAVDETAIEKREGLLRGSAYTWTGVLDASPEQIGQAAEEWARSTGWYPVASSGGKPAYKFGRTSWLGGTWIKLATLQDEAGTKVWVEAGALPTGNSAYVPRRVEYQRVAERFADGLRRQLAFNHGTLTPSKAEKWARLMERKRRTTRVMATAFWAIPAAGVVLTTLVWLATRNTYWVTAAFAWFSLFWSTDYILRLRLTGMKVVPLTALAVIPLLSVAVLFTVVAATGSH